MFELDQNNALDVMSIASFLGKESGDFLCEFIQLTNGPNLLLWMNSFCFNVKVPTVDCASISFCIYFKSKTV